MNRSTARRVALAAAGTAAWVGVVTFFVAGFLTDALVYSVPLVVLYFALLHGPVHERRVQFVKVGVAVLAIQFSGFAMLVQDPTLWAEQLARDLDKDRLILPHDPAVEELRVHFEEFLESKPKIDDEWHWASYDGRIDVDRYYYGYYNLSNLDYSALTNFEKLLLVDFYVRNNTIEWTEDLKVYGVSDYKGAPSEVLREKDYGDPNSRARDDCDGIAVVTVSLLRNLNESGWIDCRAYVGAGRQHWYTVAFLPEMEQPAFLYYWRSVHAWAYFDGDEFHLGQPLAYTVADVVFDADPESVAEAISYVHWMADNLALTLLLAFGVAVGGTLLLRYPRHPSSPRASPAVRAGEVGRGGSRRSLATKVNPFQRSFKYTWITIAAVYACLVVGLLLYATALALVPDFSQVLAWVMVGLLAGVVSRDGFARAAASSKPAGAADGNNGKN
ncbi:MAG: hypothetical protein Kow0069_27980 [Promethearchaeota archaeon]